MERACVGETDDGSRMKSLPDHQPRGEMLPSWNTTNKGGAVAGLDPRGEAELLCQIALQICGIDTVTLGLRGVLGWRAEHRGELAIEVDQLLSDCPSFVGIGAEELGRREAAQNRGEFPAKIETVLH